MALEKMVGYCGEFLTDGHVQVCRTTTILEDGMPISSMNHRYILAPGDDYSGEHEIVKAVCAAVHTPEKVVAFQSRRNKKRP